MNEFELYKSGMSIPEVSQETGIARSTLRFRFKNAGILRSISEGIKLAKKRGRITSLKGKSRGPMPKEWRENISKAKKGKGAGKTKKPNGYIEYTMGDNKFRSEHVVLMEEKIGRRLFSNECVHHKNHIRDDNRIENLELMTRSEHARIHALEANSNRQRDKKGRYI